jgi:hypothetical protein
VGYRWYPAEQDAIFVTAWGGFGAMTPPLWREESGTQSFQPFILFPFGSVHLGVEL